MLFSIATANNLALHRNDIKRSCLFSADGEFGPYKRIYSSKDKVSFAYEPDQGGALLLHLLHTQKKGATEDEMVRWHHQLNEHDFEQTPGNNKGQGSLACCSL